LPTFFDRRENNFDFVRLSLAIIVLFSHSYFIAYGDGLLEPFKRLTHQRIDMGYMAVDSFFIISGFLITASYERSRSWWSYLNKRICRIFPGFLVASLFCALIALPIGGGIVAAVSSPVTRDLHFMASVLQLHEFASSGGFSSNPWPLAVDNSMWSVSYEFWCYIAVMVLGSFGLLRNRRALVALFFLSIAASVFFVVTGLHTGARVLGPIVGAPHIWSRLLPMYLSGVVFYRFRNHLSLKRNWIIASVIGFVIALLAPLAWQILFPFVGAYLILTVAFHPSIQLHRVGRFGDFSYGTYLYGFPVQQIIVHLHGNSISVMRLFALSLPATLACAFLSWHLVEKWYIQRIRPVVPEKLAKDPDMPVWEPSTTGYSAGEAMLAMNEHMAAFRSISQ
jgi:peptidoglycan/LPS O-acetylase OafA/YrhL